MGVVDEAVQHGVGDRSIAEPIVLPPTDQSMTIVGTVGRLWCYPVKSMLGEMRPSIRLDARGVVGDRVFALRAANGKLGSGKTTRRFQRIDGLFRFRAALRDGHVEIELPDGRVVFGTDPNVHAALSDAVGEPVTLVEEEGVSHLDAAPVHVLTTGALRSLERALPHTDIDERRFRPNILISTAPASDVEIERSWIGETIHVGERVVLRVRDLAVRCVMVGLPQSGVTSAPEILQTVASGADSCFGVYAEVVRSGDVRCGDTVRLAGRSG